MSSDATELGRGIFGYRKSAVNQIISDRDIMLRQAEGRVRNAEGKVAELETELFALRDRNNRIDEQLERLRGHMNALTSGVDPAQISADMAAEAVAAGAGPPPEAVPWRDEALDEVDDQADLFVSSDTDWAVFDAEAEPEAEPQGPEVSEIGEIQYRAPLLLAPDEPSEDEEDEDEPDPFGPSTELRDLSLTDPFVEFADMALDGALDPAADQPEAEAAPMIVTNELDEAPAEIRWLSEAAAPIEDDGEDDGEESPSILEWTDRHPQSWAGREWTDDDDEEEEDVPVHQSVAEWAAESGLMALDTDEGEEPHMELIESHDDDAVHASIEPAWRGEGSPEPAPEEAPARAEVDPAPTRSRETSDITNRFLTEEIAGILSAAEESAGRIVERARTTTQHQLAQSNRLWREVQSELARYAAWRDSVEPVIRAMHDKVDGVRDEIEQVPERIRQALAPMADSISAVDGDLSELLGQWTPPLLLAPSGLAGEAEAGSEEGFDFDVDRDADASGHRSTG